MTYYRTESPTNLPVFTDIPAKLRCATKVPDPLDGLWNPTLCTYFHWKKKNKTNDAKFFFLERITIDDNEQDLDVPLMGFPDAHNFALKGPGPREYARSLYFVRDALGFQIFRSMGRWSPRTQYCVLFIKSKSSDSLQTQYQGVYMLEVCLLHNCKYFYSLTSIFNKGNGQKGQEKSECW